MDQWLGCSEPSQAQRSVIAAESELQDAGKKLGAYWRRGDIELNELESRRQRYKKAIADFIGAVSTTVR